MNNRGSGGQSSSGDGGFQRYGERRRGGSGGVGRQRGAGDYQRGGGGFQEGGGGYEGGGGGFQVGGGGYQGGGRGYQGGGGGYQGGGGGYQGGGGGYQGGGGRGRHQGSGDGGRPGGGFKKGFRSGGGDQGRRFHGRGDRGGGRPGSRTWEDPTDENLRRLGGSEIMPQDLDEMRERKIQEIQRVGIFESEPYPDRERFRTTGNKAMGHPIGKRIDLVSNHFKLTPKRFADWRINVFDVVIEVPRFVESSPMPPLPGAAAGDTAVPTKSKRKDRGGNRNGTASASDTAGHKMLRESTDTTVATSKITKQLPRALNRRIFDKFLQDNCKQLNQFHIGYDGGKMAYALPGLEIAREGTTWKGNFTEDDGRQRFYSVTLRPSVTGYETEMSELVRFMEGQTRDRTNVTISKHTMALSVILQQIPSLAYIPVGRSFFSPKGAVDISGGLMLYHGFFFSIRACQWGLDAIVDVSGTAFVQEGDVVSVVTKHLYPRGGPRKEQEIRQNGFRPDDVKKASKFLNRLKVEMKHTGHRHRVVKVTDQPIEKLTFTMEENGQGRMVRVVDYFNEKYPKFALEYPKLQALHVGNPNRSTYMPIELATIPANQSYLLKLAPEQTSKIMKVMARPPAERFEKIEEDAKELYEMKSPGGAHSSKEVLAEHGIEMDLCLRTVEGLVLNPVPIEVGGSREKNQYLEPENGTWNMVNRTFVTGKDLGEWKIFSFLRSPEETEYYALKFVPTFQKNGRDLGMKIPDPHKPCVQVNVNNFENKVKEFVGKEDKVPKENNKYIIVFLAGGHNEYETVKNTCDKGTGGVLSQCITKESLKKLNDSDSLLKQFVLKTNGKCGGINFVPYYPDVRYLLEIMVPIMVVGADVTHPGPGNKNIPSLVALVSSQDRLGVDYFTQTRAQQQGAKGATEYILDMKDLMKNAIQRFFDKNNCEPRKILFYRDGVGEGQFQEVRTYEIAKIQEACRELGTAKNVSYTPGVTFIVCQKRHHTRFKVKNERDGKGKNKNIPAGTVVDQQVVDPYLMDFFLCSHEGIQGTSKPTHYFVLWDDNDVSREGIKRLTFSFCHGYFRCPRAVSIPAPCSYAHLAAFRAKIHIDDYMKRCAENKKAPEITEINRILDVNENPIMKNNKYFL